MDEEAKFLQLPDGRQIAYREQGLNKKTATRSLLVLHGLGSSRIAGMPGAKSGHTTSSFGCPTNELNCKFTSRNIHCLARKECV